ncbi:U6 small nuclear RNA (adenine-(43)-N(6))-methyltransferase isoform X2 [Achroia grisella]|uniref:U6 small nuclear RNA (adenine-(43)-N(6))-methyltransferase isoform X2 n=1 Tax=Achroia grisella TaxID=688607 RepID=UPI0027D22A9E|nr:U6 small nuclear RNA (adenine-(43)-N(6))-methyltransferase isoform X2 [Achroia grisella]
MFRCSEFDYFYVIFDVTGKVTIDFKDPHALRVLTKYLLKDDFDLDVDIPDDRLVPTLPLRLNYILWIEDLLNAIGQTNNVWGVDIGTGACAIYPLLAAKRSQWHMIGTETDDLSFQKAQENVKQNCLFDFIEVKKNMTSSIIEHLFTDEIKPVLDFSMCNPPFYSSVQELCESRSPARLPPKNGFTGSPQELITEGGELQFCRKYLKESKMYKNRILIYTTMIGHKYNLKELLQDLKSEGITHTYTEFCQGRVTRWGLAWTYEDFNIFKLVPPRDQPRKKHAPIVYLVPSLDNTPHNVDTVTDKLIIILNMLSISHKVINKRGNNIILDVTAAKNTWSNQRRKRRLMKKLESNDPKKIKIDDTECIYSSSTTGNDISITEITNSGESNTENNGYNMKPQTSTENNEGASATESIVHAILKVLKKDNDILMQMEYLDGNAGKEGVHQIVQYIKNNWK